MWLPSLLDRLAASTDSGAAARALFSVLPEAPAPLLRVMLHQRTAAGYLALEVQESRRGRAPSGLGPTGSAWEWAQRVPDGVVFDIGARTAYPVHQPGASEPLPIVEAMTEQSRKLLSARDARFVVVVGLRPPGGAVGSVLTAELGAGAVSTPWAFYAGELRIRARVAAPYIFSLPRPTVRDGLEDEHLPVVGAELARLLPALAVVAGAGELILLRGPTGAGKTMLARWIHARSANRRGPYQPVSLASVPTSLLATTLYGSRKGAHSTAAEDVRGLIEAADGGVLFMDELGCLDAEGQAVLLELLDRRTWRPVGGGALRPLRAQLVLATNEDLEARVRDGSFRSDLYHRITGWSFAIPAMDARRDEVPRWVELAMRGGPPIGVSPEAAEVLRSRRYDGNLRELYQLCQRAKLTAIARGVACVEPTDLLASAPTRGGVLVAMETAAAAFAAEAGRVGLRLEDADSFRAYVLDAAVAAAGELRGGFERLGEHALVAGRNHHGEAKKLRARRAAFEAKIRV